MLAGEAPRRFAHHSITELPAAIGSEYWSAPILRVLEKATQRRAENRYQTVQEFWDELADAALPPTRPLSAENLKAARRPSSELSIEPEEITEAPPKARFELAQAPELAHAGLEPSKRPRIVVPVSRFSRACRERKAFTRVLAAKDIVAAFPDQSADAVAEREIFVRAGSVASAGTSRPAKEVPGCAFAYYQLLRNAAGHA